jgi:hypothetical protein
MASTKRVDGDYNIYTNRLTVHGDLTVTGTQTAATTVNSQITNNMFLLNAGELGSGVTAGTSGLKVNRGILPNTYWMFSEVGSCWSGTLNGGLTVVRAASPLSNDDVVTKGYLSSGSAIVTSSNDRAIQFNNAGALGGNSQFNYFSNGNVQIGNTIISNNATISTTLGDIVLDANGGKTYLKDGLKLQFQTGATPTNIASTIQIIANAPGAGGSGLYVVNTLGSEELINKRKATWLGLVFS